MYVQELVQQFLSWATTGMESDPPLQASDEPLPPGANGVTTNGGVCGWSVCGCTFVCINRAKMHSEFCLIHLL